MRECDNSKIHISNNSLLSICLLIMLDTLLLVPALHCLFKKCAANLSHILNCINYTMSNCRVIVSGELIRMWEEIMVSALVYDHRPCLCKRSSG